MSETRRKLWRFPEPVDETSQPEPPTPENTSSMVRVAEAPKTKSKVWRCSVCSKCIGSCTCPESDDDLDDDDEDDDDEFDF